MKRASNFWPKIKIHLETENSTDDEIIFPQKSDFLQGASFGLVNLQIMHRLNMSEILTGSYKTYHERYSDFTELYSDGFLWYHVKELSNGLIVHFL